MKTSTPADEITPSAHQQRRERAYVAIHQIAFRLVIDKGLKATTTEEIADKAQVSPRTLFNYFTGKEDAVLGLGTPELTNPIPKTVQFLNTGYEQLSALPQPCSAIYFEKTNKPTCQILAPLTQYKN